MPKLFVSPRWRKRIDASPLVQRLRWRAEAALLVSFWALCARLTPERAGTLGRWLLERIGPRFHKSVAMRRTLELAFPERPAGEIEQLLRAVWGNMGTVLAEYPHLAQLCRPGSGHLEIDAEGPLEALRTTGRPPIFVGGHLGSWEVGPAAPVAVGLPIAVVYQPLENPHLDRRLRALREGIGCTLLPRESSARDLLRAAREGRAIGLIVDHRDDDGVPLPFFGHDKLSTLAPARMALRLRSSLFVARVVRLGPARYRISATGPILPDDPHAAAELQALQMMRKVHALFEQWIRERPGEWLCSKRPWSKELYGKRPGRRGPTAAPASRDKRMSDVAA